MNPNSLQRLIKYFLVKSITLFDVSLLEISKESMVSTIPFFVTIIDIIIMAFNFID